MFDEMVELTNVIGGLANRIFINRAYIKDIRVYLASPTSTVPLIAIVDSNSIERRMQFNTDAELNAQLNILLNGNE